MPIIVSLIFKPVLVVPEVEDWGAMLLRMYLRYCERKGFQVEIMEQSRW